MRNVIVTGASGGLGAAIKKLLKEKKYKVKSLSLRGKKPFAWVIGEGSLKCSVLILNHGVWDDPDIFWVNTQSSMAMADDAHRNWIKQKKKGHIIFILSNSAYFGFAGNEYYSATKAALLGYARCLRQTCKPHGIKISTISPGTIGKTKFWNKAKTDNRKKGCMKPEMVADLVYSIIKAGEQGACVTELIVLPEAK